MSLVLGVGLGWALTSPVGAGEVMAFRGTGWVGFVVADGELAKRLSKQDLFFLGLELRRRVFQQFGPLSQLEQQMPVVVAPEAPAGDAAELARAIERLGRLMREAERERSGAPK